MNKAWKAAAAAATRTRWEMSAFTAAGSATIEDPSAGDGVAGPYGRDPLVRSALGTTTLMMSLCALVKRAF